MKKKSKQTYRIRPQDVPPDPITPVRGSSSPQLPKPLPPADFIRLKRSKKLIKLDEGILYLLGKEPTKDYWRRLESEPELMSQFTEIDRLARDSIDLGQLKIFDVVGTDYCGFSPRIELRVFLSWAEAEGLAIPNELFGLLDAQTRPERSQSEAQENKNTSVKREELKAETKALHDRWQTRINELHKDNPTKTHTALCNQIAKEDIAEGRESPTIRRNTSLTH